MTTEKKVRIILAGSLAKRFRPEWNLYLNKPSVVEALHAINVNTKGELFRYLGGAAAKRFYKIAVGRKDSLLRTEELGNPTGSGTIYILPTVAGSEKAWQKIGAAILIAAVTYFTLGVGSTLATTLYGVASSLALGGIIQLLTPVPSFNSKDDDSRGSNIFGGNASVISQGGAVGLVYGRMLVTPMPISLSYTAVDQPLPNSFASGDYDVIEGEDGIVDYVPDFPKEEDNLPDGTEG